MTKKWYGTWPANCQICSKPLGDQPFFVDGCQRKTGQWALMCPMCFMHWGYGVGTGVGQKYDSQTLEKIEG